jgi:hypothetical protein
MALVDNKKVFAFTIDVTSKESIEVSFCHFILHAHILIYQKTESSRKGI